MRAAIALTTLDAWCGEHVRAHDPVERAGYRPASWPSIAERCSLTALARKADW